MLAETDDDRGQTIKVSKRRKHDQLNLDTKTPQNFIFYGNVYVHMCTHACVCVCVSVCKPHLCHFFSHLITFSNLTLPCPSK